MEKINIEKQKVSISFKNSVDFTDQSDIIEFLKNNFEKFLFKTNSQIEKLIKDSLNISVSVLISNNDDKSKLTIS